MGSLYFVYLDLGWIHAYLCVFACLRRQATLSHSHEARHTCHEAIHEVELRLVQVEVWRRLGWRWSGDDCRRRGDGLSRPVRGGCGRGGAAGAVGVGVRDKHRVDVAAVTMTWPPLL